MPIFGSKFNGIWLNVGQNLLQPVFVSRNSVRICLGLVGKAIELSWKSDVSVACLVNKDILDFFDAVHNVEGGDHFSEVGCVQLS